MKLRAMTYSLLLATLFAAMLCMASCSNHSVHWPALLQVESFIEQHHGTATDKLIVETLLNVSYE